MVKAEMSSIINDVNTNEQADKPREIPSVAKHILLCMFIRWNKEGASFKTVVARFSVGKSSGETLMNTVRKVIRALASRGFVVNQIASDGATENVSAMKQMATIITNDAFSNLDPRSPQDVPAASKHPTFPSVLVFI